MCVLLSPERPSNPLPPEEELTRQTAALKRMYPKSHQLLDSPLGSTLTPVQEEEFELSPPLPPLPGELNEPLPPLPGETSTFHPPSSDNSTLPPQPGESQVSPAPYISPLPPLPGETGPSPMSPGVAAVASARESVREMEELQLAMVPPPDPSPPKLPPPPPQRSDPPTSPQLPPPLGKISEDWTLQTMFWWLHVNTVFHCCTEEVEEEGAELTSEELEAIVEDLGRASQSSERGEGEGEEQRDGKRDEEEEEEEEGDVKDIPWEPKAQWEDNNVKVGEGGSGERKKGRIWSFLEEKTRVSNEERAQASTSSKLPTPPRAPVFRSVKYCTCIM